MSGFVKLDTAILTSTLWPDRDMRDVFITALLMAEPFELLAPTPQIEVNTLHDTGWMVPAGWYGFVPAAGVGILRTAGIDTKLGMAILATMGSPEDDSRSREFDGRRLVRVNGGYIVLNFMKYRDHDYTAKDRMKRWREREKTKMAKGPTIDVTRNVLRDTRNVTPSEAEADPDLSGSSSVPLRADPDPDRAIPVHPVGRLNTTVEVPAALLHIPPTPIGSHTLTQMFSLVRSRHVPGALPWVTARPRMGEDKAQPILDLVNADQAARDDLERTMALLFAEAAADPKGGDRILSDVTWAFGVWCAQFTRLREKLRGVRVPKRAQTSYLPPAI